MKFILNITFYIVVQKVILRQVITKDFKCYVLVVVCQGLCVSRPATSFYALQGNIILSIAKRYRSKPIVHQLVIRLAHCCPRAKPFHYIFVKCGPFDMLGKWLSLRYALVQHKQYATLVPISFAVLVLRLFTILEVNECVFYTRVRRFARIFDTQFASIVYRRFATLKLLLSKMITLLRSLT